MTGVGARGEALAALEARLPQLGALGFDAAFAEHGVSASALLELLLELEDDLGIVFENEELRPDIMRAPSGLLPVIERKLAARVAAPKKRLAYLLSRFLPHVSGPQRALCDLWANVRTWIDFEVYTYDLAPGLPEREVIDGIMVSRFQVPRLTELIRLRRRFRKVAASCDLDVEQVCNYSLRSSNILRALRDSCPDAIVSKFYHGVLAQDIIDFFPSVEWIMIPTFFQPPGDRDPNPAWWDIGRVDRLILGQERDRALALEHGLDPRKITVLPLLVDTDRFRPLTGEERDPDTLLYVGRLVPNKGLYDFLETFASMIARRPSLRLRLIADLGSPVALEQQEIRRIRHRVADLGLDDHVEFAGRRDGEDLVREYSRHSIHILPSIADCYSFVTMEALACGMQCVNLDNPAYDWQRAIDDGEPLVHLCPDFPAMGRTILRLLEANEPRSHRTYMIENLSWGKYRHAYRDALIG